MEAMILAAGLGTRLRELTDDKPKALVEVGGVAMIEHVARRLVDAGVERLIINVHHFADQVVDYVKRRRGFGVEVAFSREVDHPLETGGGLKKAAHLFDRSAPFILHNADILSEIPLGEMYRAQMESGDALATLATMQRPTSRRLLFDQRGLFGRVDNGKDLRLEVREPVGEVEEKAFGGIHVISPRLLDLLDEEGAFSILDPYLRLCAREPILPFDADGYDWIDIGKPEQLAQARQRAG